MAADAQSRRAEILPTYLWAVTKNLNQQLEFKVAERDGVLGYYDTLTPLSITCHHATTDGYHVKAFPRIPPAGCGQL